MNKNINDFLNIPVNIERKEFFKNNFSDIREYAPIDSFFKNEWYNYQICGIYNYLSDNNSHKYLIVKFEEDEVLVSIKFVTNFKNVYLRLLHFPKSLTKNKENEYRVFEKLKQYEYIQLLWENENNINNYDFNWIKRIVDTNFYDIVKDRWKDIHKGDYLKKRKIKRFLSDSDFYLKKATINDLPFVEDCFNEWSVFKNTEKGLHNKKLFNKLFKNFNYVVSHSEIEVLLFKYKDVVLGCSIYVKMGDSYQNIVEFSRTTRSCLLNIEDPRFKVFLQGSAQIMNYFHLKYFLNKM